ncbi:N-acyl-L-amino acid amidohydrolase [Gemmatimonadetes bacterium T265]|nr:N-acyl-L-amino acid amidohydrolase [Gemmatimonadetes bacterium T265]
MRRAAPGASFGAALGLVLGAAGARAQAAPPGGPRGGPSPDAEIARRAETVLPKVVAWRRDLHEHPELSNQETRTSAIVAAHLKALGLEVHEGVGGHGVVGVLRGGKPGKIVALRADMDALPVTEQVDLPFKSAVRSTYNGQAVGVMHACGHDMHTSMLMGAAEVLAGMKAELPGTVVFLFQPNEEGDPGKPSGAKAMLAAGAMDGTGGALGVPKPDAVFGLHVGITPDEVGHLTYRPNGFMAAADFFRVVVRGRQTHGSTPWAGVDPVVAASYAVTALQTVVSRQTNLTVGPAVVTVGALNAGVRNNIIPDSAVLLGTIRTFDPAMRREIHDRVRRTVELAAQAQGATAEVTIEEMTPVTANDPALTARMVATLRRVAGDAGVSEGRPVTGSEDFGYFAERVPGLFVFLGVRPKGSPETAFVSNHSPKFFADEGALPVGVRTLASLAADYLGGR